MSFLTDIIFGGVTTTIRELAGPLERAYQAKLSAQNDADRLEADKQIKFFEGQISLANTAAQNDKWWHPRTLIAWGVTFVVLKLLLWDTAFGLGVTPNPGTLVTGIILMVLGFYFGSKAVSDAAARLLAAFVQQKR